MKEIKGLVMQCIVFGIYIILYIITFPEKDSLLVVLLLMGLIAVLAVMEYSRCGSLASPLLFWYGLWLTIVTLGRVEFNIYSEEVIWNNELRIVVIASTISFFLSFVIISMPTKVKTNDYKIWCNPAVTNQITYYILLFCCIVYVINVLYLGYIPVFSGDVEGVRVAFVQAPFYYLIEFSRMVYTLVPFSIKYGKKRRIIILTILLMLLEALTGWRTMVMWNGILLLSGWFCIVDFKAVKEKRKVFGKLPIIGLAIVLFISVVAVTRGTSFKGIKWAIGYAVKTLDYYIMPNFLNLQKVIELVKPKGIFLYTTESIWGVLVDSGAVPGYENLYAEFGTFNVANYLLQPYADMGLLGCMIWSAIFGVFSASVFGLFRKKRSICYLVLVGLANLTIFTMYAGFIWVNTSTLIWLFSAYVLGAVCKGKMIKRPAKRARYTSSG